MVLRVDFVYNWSISWDQFGAIQKTPPITKHFSPAYDNVVFHLRMEITDKAEGNDADKFGVILTYEDGPLAELQDLWIYVDIIKQGMHRLANKKSPTNLQRGRGCHIPNVGAKDIDAFKEKHDLAGTPAARFRIYIMIPQSLFSYKIGKPVFDPQPAWLAERYPNLEDIDKSSYSDLQLVSSSDGGGRRKFYCHKMVIGFRSKVLDILLRNPQNEKQKSGEYEFSDLNDEAMGAVLKYLYTGDGDVVDSLSTDSVIRVGKFCGKFELTDLKYGCFAQLWRRVVEKPEDAMEILRFADGSVGDDEEARYLKNRALDVLAEKFEALSLDINDFLKGDNDDSANKQGGRLQREYVTYWSRRLDVCNYRDD